MGGMGLVDTALGGKSVGKSRRLLSYHTFGCLLGYPIGWVLGGARVGKMVEKGGRLLTHRIYGCLLGYPIGSDSGVC